MKTPKRKRNPKWPSSSKHYVPNCQGCIEAREKRVKPWALCDEHKRKYHRDWRRGNRDKMVASQRAYYVRSKLAAMTHYCGGTPKCNCCGETTLAFLTFDHLNNGGSAHRRTFKGSLMAQLRRDGYPEGYQVLCFNCNCGRAVNKNICPHKELTPKTN